MSLALFQGEPLRTSVCKMLTVSLSFSLESSLFMVTDVSCSPLHT